MSAAHHVTISTDGACQPNPGPGGYAAILSCGPHRRELCGGVRRTTNNRMEILAAVVGLEALKKPCRVTVRSDSRYLVDGMSLGWAFRWRANGWKRGDEFVKNADLWARLLLAESQHECEFVWVRGHAGDAENERCDVLAGLALRRADLPADEGYERVVAERRAAMLPFG